MSEVDSIKKSLRLLESIMVEDSSTIPVPQDNSFGVYSLDKQKWWDPKKGWVDHLTVWKARGVMTLITMTDLTQEITSSSSPDRVVAVNIFTGQVDPRFQPVIEKEWRRRHP